MKRSRILTALVAGNLILSQSMLGQSSCTRETTTFNGQPATTETFTDGNTTVTNTKDSGGNVVRTHQYDEVWEEMTIVDYDPVIGYPAAGRQRSHHKIVSDGNDHQSTVSDGDSDIATENMRTVDSICRT